MNEIDTNTAQKINAIHQELTIIARKGIDMAIEIGRLLIEKKAELSHGEFGIWIKDNLIFTDRTARNYMRLFENKDRVIEAENISEAYQILEAPKTENVSDFESVTELFRELISEQYKTTTPLNVLFDEVYNMQKTYLSGLRAELNILSPEIWQGTKDAAIKRLKKLEHESQIIQSLWSEYNIVCLRNMGKILKQYPEVEKYIISNQL